MGFLHLIGQVWGCARELGVSADKELVQFMTAVLAGFKNVDLDHGFHFISVRQKERLNRGGFVWSCEYLH
jgi:hypothetical protein